MPFNSGIAALILQRFDAYFLSLEKQKYWHCVIYVILALNMCVPAFAAVEATDFSDVSADAYLNGCLFGLERALSDRSVPILCGPALPSGRE